MHMEPLGRAVEDVVAQNVSKQTTQNQPRPSDSSATQALTSASARPRGINETKSHAEGFSCPVFEHEKSHDLPHTCSGLSAQNMSDVRRHLTRPHRGGASHLNFLKRCHICNEDIIDEHTFNAAHGSSCNNVQKLRRGSDATAVRWMTLYKLLYPNDDVIPYPFNSPNVRPASAVSIPIINKLGRLQEGETMQQTPQGESSIKPYHIIDYDYTHELQRAVTIESDQPSQVEENPELEENFGSAKDHEPTHYTGIGSGLIDNEYYTPTMSTSYPQQLDFSDFEQPDPGHLSGPPGYYPNLPRSDRLAGLSAIATMSTNVQPQTQLNDWLKDDHGWTAMTSFDRSTSRAVDAPRHQEFIQRVDQLHRAVEGTAVEDKPAEDDAPVICDICDAKFVGRSKLGNLRRHQNSKHDASVPPSNSCRVCKRVYNRKDAAKKHEWKKHRLLDAKPTRRRTEV
ncbi:hypothetical protein IQ07DRAFT_679708 [Pyrenochaeta sp. DS3sAY3a]|nr:hypothetical protein IQ07DRAFT_679708 [Pyrenochaeta sp. DS3sAY3a]